MKGKKSVLKAGAALSMALLMLAGSACTLIIPGQGSGDSTSVSGSTSTPTSSSSSADGSSTQEHLHTLAKTEAKEATCAEEGNIEYWYCADCGKYFSDSAAEHEISAEDVTTTAPHTLTRTEAVGATCAEEGNIEYWYCTVCDKYFSDENGEHEISAEDVIVTAPHTLTRTEAVAATCETAGNVEYWYCSVCDRYFSDENGEHLLSAEEITVPPSHTLVHHEAAAPSYLADGNVEYWNCSVCGKYFADGEGTVETDAESVKIGRENLGTTISSSGYSASFWHIGSSATTRNLGQGWYTFSTMGDYGGTTGVPTLVGTEEEPEYLEFTSASRFELFHVKDDVTNPGSVSYCHLGDNAAWNNDAHAGLYDYEYAYSFEVSANGPFALTLFGMSTSTPALSTKDGQAFCFDGNTISMRGTNVDNGAPALQAVATLSEGFDFGDGEKHTVTFAYNRYSRGNAVTKVYIDGVMVEFERAETATSGYYSVSDGAIVHTTYAYDMGQRFSVIPQVNSAEGAEETTYSTVRIYGLEILRYKIN